MIAGLPTLPGLPGAPFVATAHAQDVYSADLAAVGDAGIAHPRDNSVITVNPAGVGLTDQYDFQVGFTGGFDNQWSWRASAIDGRTSPFLTFGLQYAGALIHPPFHPSELPGWGAANEPLLNRRQDHDITIALAAPLLDRRLSFGLNGTLSILDRQFGRNLVTGNMDVGVATQPVEGVTLGVVAKSFLPVDTAFRTPGAIAFGARGGLPDVFNVVAEGEYRFSRTTRIPWAARAGMEGIIRDTVALRAGWNWDGERAEHRITWGFGLVAKDTGSLSYAMITPVVPNLRGREIGHAITLTVMTEVGTDAERDAPIRWND